MAFGFSPKFIEEYPVENLTTAHAMVLATETARELGWNVGQVNEHEFFAYTPFSGSSWSEEVKVTISDGVMHIKSECSGNQLFDWGKNKRNVIRFIDKFDELKVTTSAGDLELKGEAFSQSVLTFNENEADAGLFTTKGKFTGLLSLFWPGKNFVITPLIIDLNIAVFIIMVISGVNFMAPDTQSLLDWGANFRPLTIQGEWWRLVTNIFLHIGILHLLLNMYALVYIGVLLEPYLGKLRFVAAYFLTGIAASTTSLCWHSAVVSAGASGAIFGMYGVFLALLTTNFIERAARKAMLTSISVFVVFNLVNGAKGGIDNAAHIGGLVTGFGIGYFFYPGLKSPGRMDLKIGSVALLSLGILLLCFMFCKRVHNDIAVYDEKMREFTAMEQEALDFYKMPKTTPKDSVLMEIKDRGIYYWNENIELIKNLEKLDLPEALHRRNRQILIYCDLRLKSYSFIYKAIDQNSDKYNGSIDSCNKTIQRLIDSLKAQ